MAERDPRDERIADLEREVAEANRALNEARREIADLKKVVEELLKRQRKGKRQANQFAREKGNLVGVRVVTSAERLLAATSQGGLVLDKRRTGSPNDIDGQSSQGGQRGLFFAKSDGRGEQRRDGCAAAQQTSRTHQDGWNSKNRADLKTQKAEGSRRLAGSRPEMSASKQPR